MSFSDQPALIDAIMSNMAVMAWLPSCDAVTTTAGQHVVAVSYLRAFIAPWESLGFGVWAVCIADAEPGAVGDFIGYCGFIPEKIAGAEAHLRNGFDPLGWGGRSSVSVRRFFTDSTGRQPGIELSQKKRSNTDIQSEFIFRF